MKALEIALLATICFLSLPVAQAAQLENSVECVEGNPPTGNEPVLISYGDHTTNCVMDEVTDVDRFEFSGFDGDSIRIIVRSPTTMDPILEVWDPSGNPIIPGGDMRCNGACSLVVDLSLVSSGTYNMTVSEWGTDHTGTYTLQLERIFPFPSSAVGITDDLPANDVLDPSTDMDFFTFTGQTGAKIKLLVRSPTTMDPILEVWDPFGKPIVPSMMIPNNKCNGACSIVVELSLPSSGAYLVALSEWGSDHVGSYELSTACLLGPCIPPRPTCMGELATVFGSDGDNVLVGTDGDDVIVGLGGDDVINGLEGNDIICGDDGNDILRGSGGNDQLYGGDNHDILKGGPGNDILRGGTGFDVLHGGEGDDKLYGEFPNDNLFGGQGNDDLDGGPGDDICDGGPGNDNAVNCEIVN